MQCDNGTMEWDLWWDVSPMQTQQEMIQVGCTAMLNETMQWWLLQWWQQCGDKQWCWNDADNGGDYNGGGDVVIMYDDVGWKYELMTANTVILTKLMQWCASVGKRNETMRQMMLVVWMSEWVKKWMVCEERGNSTSSKLVWSQK